MTHVLRTYEPHNILMGCVKLEKRWTTITVHGVDTATNIQLQLQTFLAGNYYFQTAEEETS